MSVILENPSENHFKDYTILVVDDNSANLGIMSDFGGTGLCNASGD